MGLDIEKVAMLTGMVDKLVQMKHVDNALDESVVEELIQKALFISDVPYSDDEIAAVKRDIAYKYQIQARPGQSILADYEQANWYDDRKAEIQQNFWTRYKNYLIDEKHFSPNVVSTLGNDTLDQKLMNYILDPKADYGKPVLKRGLIIGDVQSGKTSTYIGFICKAADAGYKVFILLTGTIESLRKQTQERVEEGFIGIDMSANTTGGKRVGVGLDNKPIHAMALTSRASDFRGNSNKIAMSLGKDKDAVVFVIKKNTTTLTKLTKWLIDLNADPRTHKIDMPMLMIDDEADNASINTSSDKEDPTKINKLIRKLADVFTKSNYVGFTATPFANVFIDPETTEKMETHDLFPEDFIVALPTPSNYIGPTRIFPKDAEFHSQLVYITDAGREEEDGYSFYFEHKKDWKGKLPESMTDAIYAFYLANAIRDLRGDQREHRSMLINISRFVKVQKYIKEIVEKIHAEAYRSLKYNLSSDFELSMKDPVLNRIYKVWQSQYEKCGFTWDEVAAALFDAMEKIQIKVVNSSRSSEKLEYPKNESLRVIAIGGLALSRGLTLEGLIISYFYRNTCTYDVLMQMGRWFGYRRGYEDLFRIWTHKASAEWYAEIADATEKLKEDMVLMRDLGQKPRDFGIRVRNNSTDLNITAYNKMRNATDEFDVSSYFGSIVETPYLRFDVEAQKNNFRAVTDLVSECLSRGYRFERRATGSGRKGRYVLSDVPKELIVELIDRLSISKYSSYFNTKQISEFLSGCTDASIDVFDVAFMDGESPDKVADVCGQKITCVERKTCIIDSELDRLSIGRKGKLGGPGDGLVGIVDFNGKTAEEIIENAKASFRKFYEKEKGVPFDKTRVYPSETWFRFVVDRKPLLLIYLIDVGVAEENQKKQEAEFKAAMGNTPAVGRVLGCYIQDWDSLYLTSLFEPEIIRINKDCQILEKINYEEANDGTRLYNSSFLSFRTATLIGRDLYIYSDPNRLIEKDYVSATINLDTKEIRALPFVYPDYPGSSVKLKRYGLEGSYSRSFDEQRFVYSFIYDESVYVANIAHDSIRKVSVKSEYIDQVQLPDELTAQAIDFCQNAMYGDLIYDPYREVFYRIAYPSTTIEKGVKAMELIEYGRKTFSIIILDKELNKLGETHRDLLHHIRKAP